MRHPNVAIAILLGCTLARSVPAAAGIEVYVDVAAPFTEDDLHEAVRLRSPDTDAVVSVAKLGDDRFVVSVNGRAQLVELTGDDQSSATRVVALVVVSLIVDGHTAHAVAHDSESPPQTTLTRAPRPNRLRLSGLLTRDDNGYEFPVLNAAASHPLSAHANLVASVGIGKYDGYSTTSSLILPIRLGVEGRAGAAAIELGGQVLAYREESCGAPDWGNAQSVYGAAKVFLPISGGGKRLVAEVGGHLVLANLTTRCTSASTYTDYGGWVGLGLDWPL